MSAHKDPTSRMKKGNLKSNEDTIDKEIKKEKSEETSKLETSIEEVIPTESEDMGTKNRIPKEDLISSDELDLQQFYFTGKLEHTFKLRNFEVTLRLLDTREVEETNEILWNLMAKEISMDMVTLTHSTEVLGRAIVKYGKVDLSSKSQEERLEFIRTIPGVLIPIIAKKYTILEESMHVALTSGEVKN